MKYSKGTLIEHPIADWGIGRVLTESAGATVTADFDLVGIKTVSLAFVQPVVVDIQRDDLPAQINEIPTEKVYLGGPFQKIYEDVKAIFPEHIVIIENGVYFEVLNVDAEVCERMYGWKTYSISERQLKTGFPTQSSAIFKDLDSRGVPYVVVSQLNRGVKKIERKITYVSHLVKP